MTSPPAQKKETKKKQAANPKKPPKFFLPTTKQKEHIEARTIQRKVFFSKQQTNVFGKKNSFPFLTFKMSLNFTTTTTTTKNPTFSPFLRKNIV